MGMDMDDDDDDGMNDPIATAATATAGQEYDNVEIDFPSAPPPSMFSVSGILEFQAPEAGPSTYYQQPTYTQSQTTTPGRQEPLAQFMESGQRRRNVASVSPNDGSVMAEPYWQDGLRGIVRPGGGVDGSPLGGQGRGRGRDERGGAGLNDAEGSDAAGRRAVEEGMDLGRSVAMAMGMGMDSTLTHGDIEMVSRKTWRGAGRC